MATYCVNCKFDPGLWGAYCRCEPASYLNVRTGGSTNYYKAHNIHDLNCHFNCRFYQRKWWKFWIDKNKP